jgi:hypothetical protein
MSLVESEIDPQVPPHQTFDKEMKRPRYILLILALALFPSTASANAGTPLMWASMLHLVFGNAIIGLIEGLLLAWLFKCSKRKSILILIAANYASAWAGGFLVAEFLPSQVDITIQNIQSWFLAFVVVAFVVTLLIEFVFFWFALGSPEHRLRRTVTATLTVNGISYALLFGWYWIASGTSMLTQLEVVSVYEMKLPEPYALYYLSPEGDQIIRIDPTKPSFKETISKVTAHHRNDRLFARPREDSGFDLFVYLDSEDRGAETESRILEDFSEKAPVERRIAEGHSDKVEGSWFNFGPVPTIGPASKWAFRTGFWPAEGISGKNEKTGKKVHYALELPFAAWPVRNATQIAGDFVITQLGDDQICLMNLEAGKIALVARGRGPVVAKPKMTNKPIDSTATRVTSPAEQESRHEQP